MFIGLQELELRTVRFKVDVPAGEIDYESKISQESVLHAEGTAELLNHSLGEIRVLGDLTVTVEAMCDRCAEPAAFPIESRFDLVYMPRSDGGAVSEDEIDAAGIEVGYYEGGGLSLNEVLREVVLLALPMQLVCNENCKGICPACGQDRNQRDCGCQREEAEGRWNKLKDFRADIGPHN
jgi:uncharacterized protein